LNVFFFFAEVPYGSLRLGIKIVHFSLQFVYFMLPTPNAGFVNFLLPLVAIENKTVKKYGEQILFK
ncbi:hypothetical protein ACJX0J_027730, partial [Zea mays]